MTEKVLQELTAVVVRNIRGFMGDADDYGISEEEQEEQYDRADRIESGTATEEDWLEALSFLDMFG